MLKHRRKSGLYILMNLINIRHDEKSPKLQQCRQHFLLEALSIHQQPNKVPPKEHASAQLQFRIFFLRRRCPGQSFIVEGLKFGKKVGSDSLICTWGYDF